MGPGPGEHGGDICFNGRFDELFRSKTLTGQYLRLEKLVSAEPPAPRDLVQKAPIIRLSGVTATYTQDIVRLVAMRRDGALSEEQYLRAIEDLIAKQPFARKAAQE